MFCFLYEYCKHTQFLDVHILKTDFWAIVFKGFLSHWIQILLYFERTFWNLERWSNESKSSFLFYFCWDRANIVLQNILFLLVCFRTLSQPFDCIFSITILSSFTHSHVMSVQICLTFFLLQNTHTHTRTHAHTHKYILINRFWFLQWKSLGFNCHSVDNNSQIIL